MNNGFNTPMNSPTRQTLLAQLASALRRALFGPIGATLVVAAAAYVLVPRIMVARAVARATQCENNLFNHSGSHPADMVEIDRDFNVVDVGSCPLCSHPGAGLYFWMRDGGQVTDFSEEDVPEATILEAERWLYAYKASPRYHRLRKGFSGNRYEQMREHMVRRRRILIENSR